MGKQPRPDETDPLPWVSVLIPTYKRVTDLRETLSSLRKQQYHEHGRLEVLTLDDASPDDTKEMVLDEFPEVRYIRLPENRGQAYGRNLLAASARGQYLIFLDDDARLIDPYAVNKVVALFEDYSDVGLIMFNISTPSDPGSPRGTTDYFIHDHITCGCALRRSALEEAGGYRSLFHSGCEESDVSLRLLDNNWLIYQANEIRVFHDFAPEQRTREWLKSVRYNTARNELSMILLQFPLRMVVPAILWKCVSHLRGGWKKGITWSILRAIGAFAARSPILLRHRRAISVTTLKRYYGLRRFRPTAKEQIQEIESLSWRQLLFNGGHHTSLRVAQKDDGLLQTVKTGNSRSS